MNPRIGVVGGLNMDIHLFGVHEYAGQAPLVADRYLVEPGGKGANQARAAARLGAEVELVGRVGDDEFGRECLAAVRQDGVGTEHVTVAAGERTGFVAIGLPEGRHRSLVFAPGANDTLSRVDVQGALPSLSDADVVVVQAEVPPPALAVLIDWSAEVDVPLLLDPTPPERVTEAAIRAAAAITPGLGEALALVGRSSVSPLAPPLAARDLLELGALRVLLKLDEGGVLLADDVGLRRIAAPSVEVIDETGAGDAFMAAVAVRLAEDAAWDEAARFGAAAAALSVSRPGLALPARSEVEDAVARIAHARKSSRGVGPDTA